jgi:hypothetical protein
MIRLSVSEQQLFDMIMAVYSLGNGEDAPQDPETVRRREALLEKLHRAFDSKILAPRAEHAAAARTRAHLAESAPARGQ